MKSNLEGQRQKAINFATRCFAIIMVVLYIAMGATIIIKSPIVNTISRNYSIAFGVLLILYGLFRAVKVYRNYFTRSAEQI